MRNITLLLFVMCGFMPVVSYAAACFLEHDKGTCFTLNNKEIMKAGKTYENCKQVVASCKDDKLCYINASGGVSCLLSNDYEVDKPINVDKLSQSNNNKAILAVLADIFSPPPERKHGLKSLKTSKNLQGFPDGYILAPHDDLLIPLIDGALSAEFRFSVWEEGKANPIFSQDNVAGDVVISGALFKPEGKYRWEVIAGKDNFKGGFGIESEKYQKEFDHALAKIMEGSEKSDFSRYLMRASLAKKYGYSFDYVQSIHKAKAQMSTGGHHE